LSRVAWRLRTFAKALDSWARLAALRCAVDGDHPRDMARARALEP
jgi:hypothetical protein